VQFYELSKLQNHHVGLAHYAMSAHYGVGFCEDLELAAANYNTAAQMNEQYLHENTFRCHRSLKKARLSRSHRLIRDNGEVHVYPPPAPSFVFERTPPIESFVVGRMASVPGKIIGRGGYGQVKTKTEPTTREKIAVKEIFCSRDRDRLEREVNMMLTVRHPCVVKLLGYWPGTESYGGEIRMEWAEKGSLASLLRARWYLSPTQAAIVICDIVLGMRYVHSRDIIHRDLKPHNILLKKNWRAVICDFGISQFEHPEGRQTVDAGSVGYFAPEQLVENYPPRKEADVFAFGLVLYEILTRQPVFPETWSDLQVRKCLRSGKFPAVPGRFGSVMQDLIGRCWSIDSGARPSFAGILSEFESHNFGILPGADRFAIEQAVSEAVAWEAHAG
jgi:hypothetical protein